MDTWGQDLQMGKMESAKALRYRVHGINRRVLGRRKGGADAGVRCLGSRSEDFFKKTSERGKLANDII